MSRVLSAVALLPVVVGAIWLSAPATIVLASGVVALATREYVGIAARWGVGCSMATAVVSALTTGLAVSLAMPATPVALMAAVVAIVAVQLARPDPPAEIVRAVSAATFGLVYVAVPLGLIAALRRVQGPEPVLLLLATVIASDTAQYYGGRWLGRRPLAPVVSPGKTVEGAVFGVVAGALVLGWVGRWWLTLDPIARLLLGAAVAGLGILGDLFESTLKRSAGMKDASSLIPGHGGVLDRIDGLLFAAPVYVMVARLAAGGPW